MSKINILVLSVIYCCFAAPIPVGITNAYAEDTHEHHGTHGPEHDEHNHDENEHEEDEHHQDEHDEHGHEENTLEVSNKQIEEFGIEIRTAAPGLLQKFVEVPGEVVVNQDRLSHISARFPGIVKEVKKKIGDTVNENDVLAIIESNESLTTYEVKSLISGTVIDKHATLGELLKEEDTAYTIADLSTVWINFSIYQADLPNIREGQSVVISQGHGQLKAEGTISYVSPVVDEETRTATARVTIRNKDSRWAPGLFVTGKIEVANENVGLLVPKSAIHSIENQPAVFVKTNEGFKATKIKLGRSNEYHAEVLSGLHKGQQVATKNGFSLKAELSKSSFEDGHNH